MAFFIISTLQSVGLCLSFSFSFLIISDKLGFNYLTYDYFQVVKNKQFFLCVYPALALLQLSPNFLFLSFTFFGTCSCICMVLQVCDLCSNSHYWYWCRINNSKRVLCSMLATSLPPLTFVVIGGCKTEHQLKWLGPAGVKYCYCEDQGWSEEPPKLPSFCCQHLILYRKG